MSTGGGYVRKQVGCNKCPKQIILLREANSQQWQVLEVDGKTKHVHEPTGAAIPFTGVTVTDNSMPGIHVQTRDEQFKERNDQIKEMHDRNIVTQNKMIEAIVNQTEAIEGQTAALSDHIFPCLIDLIAAIAGLKDLIEKKNQDLA